jgi:hypothetical protein
VAIDTKKDKDKDTISKFKTKTSKAVLQTVKCIKVVRLSVVVSRSCRVGSLIDLVEILSLNAGVRQSIVR